MKHKIVKTKDQLIKDQSCWIQTFTGKRFQPLFPSLESISIIDIAHALSKICRFNGHTSGDQIYSVAQHSVLVSYICDEKDRLGALLHDASEAMGLSDIPTPIKKSGYLEDYIQIEHNLQSMIYKRFGLAEEEPESVKIADKILLATEARDLMSPLHPDFKLEYDPLPFTIIPISPKEANQLFLSRFDVLFARNHDKTTKV